MKRSNLYFGGGVLSFICLLGLQGCSKDPKKDEVAELRQELIDLKGRVMELEQFMQKSKEVMGEHRQHIAAIEKFIDSRAKSLRAKVKRKSR